MDNPRMVTVQCSQPTHLLASAPLSVFLLVCFLLSFPLVQVSLVSDVYLRVPMIQLELSFYRLCLNSPFDESLPEMTSRQMERDSTTTSADTIDDDDDDGEQDEDERASEKRSRLLLDTILIRRKKASRTKMMDQAKIYFVPCFTHSRRLYIVLFFLLFFFFLSSLGVDLSSLSSSRVDSNRRSRLLASLMRVMKVEDEDEDGDHDDEYHNRLVHDCHTELLDVLLDEDDMLIECLTHLAHIHAALSTWTIPHDLNGIDLVIFERRLTLLDRILNPFNLFVSLLHSLGYDSTLLLDFLISEETSVTFLQYLLIIIRLSKEQIFRSATKIISTKQQQQQRHASTMEDDEDDDEESSSIDSRTSTASIERTMACLIQLRISIEKLVAKVNNNKQHKKRKPHASHASCSSSLSC